MRINGNIAIGLWLWNIYYIQNYCSQLPFPSFPSHPLLCINVAFSNVWTRDHSPPEHTQDSTAHA